MNTELATTEPQTLAIPANERGIKVNSLADLMEFAQLAVRSNLTPKELRTPEAVFIAVQHGMELGLSPAQALQSIAVINGRPCVWGDAAIGIVRAHPQFEDISETLEGKGEEIEAVCMVKRRGSSTVTRRFSKKDADRAGLTGKSGPWTQYPKRMLQLRARGFALRDAFPDALKGLHTSDEVQDYPSREEKVVERVKLVMPDETTEAAAFALEDAQ